MVSDVTASIVLPSSRRSKIDCFSFESANQSKLTTRINELKAKFEKARSILATIPGIDMSQKEQEEYYLKLLKQYEQENELLQSYKDMCKFDIANLDNPSSTEKGRHLVLIQLFDFEPLMSPIDLLSAFKSSRWITSPKRRRAPASRPTAPSLLSCTYLRLTNE